MFQLSRILIFILLALQFRRSIPHIFIDALFFFSWYFFRILESVPPDVCATLVCRCYFSYWPFTAQLCTGTLYRMDLPCDVAAVLL